MSNFAKSCDHLMIVNLRWILLFYFRLLQQCHTKYNHFVIQQYKQNQKRVKKVVNPSFLPIYNVDSNRYNNNRYNSKEQQKKQYCNKQVQKRQQKYNKKYMMEQKRNKFIKNLQLLQNTVNNQQIQQKYHINTHNFINTEFNKSPLKYPNKNKNKQQLKQRYLKYLPKILEIDQIKKSQQKQLKQLKLLKLSKQQQSNQHHLLKLPKDKFKQKIQQFMKWSKQYKSVLSFNTQSKSPQLSNSIQIHPQYPKYKKPQKFKLKQKLQIKQNQSINTIINQQKCINSLNYKKYGFSSRTIKQQRPINLIKSIQCNKKRFHSFDTHITKKKSSPQLPNQSNQQITSNIIQKYKNNKNISNQKQLSQKQQVIIQNQQNYSPKKFIRYYQQQNQLLIKKQKILNKNQQIGQDDRLVSINKLLPQNKRIIKQSLKDMNRMNGCFSSIKKYNKQQDSKSYRKSVKKQQQNINQCQNLKKYLIILNHRKYQSNIKNIIRKNIFQQIQNTQKFLQTNLLYSPWEAASNHSNASDQSISQNSPQQKKNQHQHQI